MAARQLSDANTSGTTLGQSATDLVSFHGSAVTSQRTSAAQVTMTVSGLTLSSTVGFISTVQISLLFGQVAEIRQTLVDYGLWKGS